MGTGVDPPNWLAQSTSHCSVCSSFFSGLTLTGLGREIHRLWGRKKIYLPYYSKKSHVLSLFVWLFFLFRSMFETRNVPIWPLGWMDLYNVSDLLGGLLCTLTSYQWSPNRSFARFNEKKVVKQKTNSKYCALITRESSFGYNDWIDVQFNRSALFFGYQKLSLCLLITLRIIIMHQMH
jgi:hypothetical protein